MNIDTRGDIYDRPAICDNNKLKHLLTCSYPSVPTCISRDHIIGIEGKSMSVDCVSMDYMEFQFQGYPGDMPWQLCGTSASSDSWPRKRVSFSEELL